ncbi:MAG: cell envelope integrity protein CreD, partial [Gammaproteobacteria bacterium]|nr:cell envelope integrity protein CreD [Gammaproteobacteria bacterium]
TFVVQPQRLGVTSTIGTETLKRGIYSSELYSADTRIQGQFSIPARGTMEQPAPPGKRVEYAWGRPFLVLSVTDPRGIRKLGGTAAGLRLGFQPGTGVSWLHQGLNAELGATVEDESQAYPFDLQLTLMGTSQLAISPVGKATNVVLHGTWPHPSFAGRFAPTRREITDRGFTVEWQTTYWATGINDETIARCVVAGSKCSLFDGDQLGLRLVDPVDQYLLTERTVKYAELFVLLIFASFFMMEVTKQLSIHPMQYALVGLSLAVFFLLTLSLSEHVPFNVAYWVAAAGSIALLGYYVTHVLGGWRRGFGFSALLSSLYGLLFGILQSEDAALLMGSVALFALLAAVMVITRNIDWYSIPAFRRLSENTP